MNDALPPAAPRAPVAATDSAAQSLAWFRTHQMAPAARALMSALLQVVSTRLEHPQGRLLLQLVGRALAGERPLDPCATLADIEARASARLMELGLGWCRMREVDGWLEIVHCELPAFEGQGERLPLVLEGLYEGWLQAAGADPALRAVWLRSEAEPIPQALLRFGHPERIASSRDPA